MNTIAGQVVKCEIGQLRSYKVELTKLLLNIYISFSFFSLTCISFKCAISLPFLLHLLSLITPTALVLQTFVCIDCNFRGNRHRNHFLD